MGRSTLALVAAGLAVVGAAACGGSGSSSGAGGGSGGSSGSSGGCDDLSGSWNLSGTCGADFCEVSQTGCDVRILCNEDVDYRGRVDGDSLDFDDSGSVSKADVRTCTLMISSTEKSWSGSCDADASGARGACTVKATAAH